MSTRGEWESRNATLLIRRDELLGAPDRLWRSCVCGPHRTLHVGATNRQNIKLDLARFFQELLIFDHALERRAQQASYFGKQVRRGRGSLGSA